MTADTAAFRLDATAPDATKDSLLVVEGNVDKKLPAKGDTLTDGTTNEWFLDDLNAMYFNVPEALGKLEIIIKDPGAKDETGTNLTVTSRCYDECGAGCARLRPRRLSSISVQGSKPRGRQRRARLPAHYPDRPG